MSMKKSNETIGNRTLNLPACSAVPQPTAPPRALIGWVVVNYKLGTLWTEATNAKFCSENLEVEDRWRNLGTDKRTLLNR
jgi:hypothetical protein